MFRACRELLAEHGFGLPALIPQVYLHYDPYTQGRRSGAAGPLPRQRMDYLMLLRGHRRLVIEIDGKHHYADGERASPRLYAEMKREDRALRLDGYEVFRFGGYDFCDAGQATLMVRDFLERILRTHGYLPPMQGPAGSPGGRPG